MKLDCWSTGIHHSVSLQETTCCEDYNLPTVLGLFILNLSVHAKTTHSPNISQSKTDNVRNYKTRLFLASMNLFGGKPLLEMPIGSQNCIAIWNSSYNPLPFFSLPQGLKVLLNSLLPLDLFFIFPRSFQWHFYCLLGICFPGVWLNRSVFHAGVDEGPGAYRQGCESTNRKGMSTPKQNRGKECGALPVPFAATSPCLDLRIVSSLGLIPWVFQFFLNKIPSWRPLWTSVLFAEMRKTLKCTWQVVKMKRSMLQRISWRKKRQVTG